MINDSAHHQIVERLRAWITTAPPGAQLPSTRRLTAEHGASPVTVQRAIRQLQALGLVESRPGVGTFVRPQRSVAPVDYAWQTSALGARPVGVAALPSTQRGSDPDLIRLHSGYPSGDLLPGRLVRAALARASRSETALTRSPVAGLPELQAWFASQVAATTSGSVTPPVARDVIVLPGSQSGLSSVFRALVGPGRPLLVESPTYWGAIRAADQAGVTLVPVASGTGGPDPDEVERALDATGARAFYVQPSFANPTGAQWSVDTSRRVLEVARARGTFLIEDDWAHDLGIDAEPRPLVGHDDDGHVVYLRSLTKSVSPALRIAGIVARGPARERILVDRAGETMYVSGILQSAALDVVTQPAWPGHLRAMKRQLRARRDLLVECLRAHAPEVVVEQVPVGGLNLWVRLPDGSDVHRVVGACENSGLLVAPGTEWFPAEPSGPYVRLNYGSEDPRRFAQAAELLGEAVRSVR